MSTTTIIAPATDRQMSFLNTLIAERGGTAPYDGPELTRAEASATIEAWKSRPRAVVESTASELTFGVYQVGADVYRVYPARSGRLLAALITVDGFDYQGLASRFVKPEHRLSLDQVAAYGHQFGSCCVCGRLLTVPESVAAGIGPVCAEKY